MGARTERSVTLARKAVELALRTALVAPEFRSARRLRSRSSADRRGGAATAQDAPHVLMLSPRDWVEHVQNQAMIAHALRARGARVSFSTCSGGLEICDRANVYEAPPMPCRSCRHYTRHALGAHGFDVVPLGDPTRHAQVDWPELDGLTTSELRQVAHGGVPVGELVDIPVKWFLCAADLDDDPLVGHITRAFLRSARAVVDSTRELLDRTRPDVVVLTSGLFLFESIAHALCLEQGIQVVTYERAFLKDTLVVSRGEPAGRYDLSAEYEHDRRPLTAAEGGQLDDYLTRRRRGGAFDQYWQFSDSTLASGEGRTTVLFTNLTWDSAVIGRDRAFDGIRDWIDTTIGLFAEHPAHRLVIRIHPSEVFLPGKRTRDPIGDHVSRVWNPLPPNVTVVPAGDPQSSYDLMDRADLGLVYTSTTGLEMALSGKPVVVAGMTHYAGKGFTVDPDDRASYVSSVERLLADPSAGAVDVEAAREYAHYFFFRAPVPTVGVVETLPGLARITITDPEELAPGRSAEVDRLCDAVLGRPG